jgi:hypothetical protein
MKRELKTQTLKWETGDAMTSRKIKQSRKLTFQSLENRCLMAGNVTAAVQNHSLVINGDNQNNDIEITQVGNGQYKLGVGQFSTTTINGKSTPQTFSGITADFKINMKGGNDIVVIDNAAQSVPVLTLPGNLNVDLGTGSDVFYLESANTMGSATVTGGTGSKVVEFDYSMIGNSNFNAGKNDCNINLSSGGVVNLFYSRFERDLSVDLGGNSASKDSVWLQGGTVGRNTAIQTGNGADSVYVTEMFIQQKLQIQTGGGNDMVSVGEESIYQNGAFLQNNSQYGMHADQMFVDLGSGDDDLHVFGVDASSENYLGNSGHDRLFHDGAGSGHETYSGFELVPSQIVTQGAGEAGGHAGGGTMGAVGALN